MFQARSRSSQPISWPAVAALLLGALAVSISIVGCGGGGSGDIAAAPADADRQASKGQTASAPAFKTSWYAASRFADQATFGPTAALVQELRTKGIEKWLDEQLALLPYQINTTPALITGNPIPPEPYRYQRAEYQKLIMAAPDQLRARITWSLSQFITVSGRKGHPVGLIDWVNMLQRQAFGRYGDLLYAAATHPYMAQYLDNDQNRPKSNECQHCAPNENFARELMQLFSLGVLKLGPDGTPLRNSRGGYIETYTQTDVEQLARALTGWAHPYEDTEDVTTRLINYNLKTMIVSTWPPERDLGEKRVLGQVFPAGQPADADLRQAVNMLIAHGNSAPFVSLRLIQHLVKSNPSPAYLGRVAAVFRDNGSGVAGDMKAVIKAVLLDSEARAGDDPAKSRIDDGYIREPALHRSAIFRALGCFTAPSNSPDYQLGAQPHLNPDSVFSFYSPADRAPGSNLLAPEQKLLTASDLTTRLGELNWIRWNRTTTQNDLSAYKNAGCKTDALITAFTRSSRDFSDYLSQSFFRGAMPPTLRRNLELLMTSNTWLGSTPDEKAINLLSFALATPYFGVIK